jgi:hypothetical protein
VLTASESQGIGQGKGCRGLGYQVVGMGVRLDRGRCMDDGLVVAAGRVELARQDELDLCDLVFVGGTP